MARKGIMLAYPFEEKRLLTWPTPWIMQPKLDGDRMRAKVGKDNEVTLLSSEENEKLFFPQIIEEIRSMNLPEDTELDGEAYIHGLEHEAIRSITGRSVNPSVATATMQFHVFDYVNEMLPQYIRFRILDVALARGPSNHIIKVPRYATVDLPDIYRLYDQFIEEGYEGFIIRNKDAKYLRRRSTFMMKFKPKKEDTYKIVTYTQERDKYGSLKPGMLGSIGCESNDGGRKVFWVGTGLTEDMRRDYWRHRFLLIGKWLKVKYQHLTSCEAGHVPRHPVFVEIVDKPGDDPNNYEVY